MSVRAWGFAVVVALVLVPAAAGVKLGAVPVEPLPVDLSDGDLLLLLAARQGWVVERPVPVEVPVGMSLGEGASLLASRAGRALAPGDVAAFDAVDPRVQAAVLPLVVALDEAWRLRDLAFVGVQEGETPDLPMLIRAAILVLDAAEGVVMPQVDALAGAGVWPASAVADPVGVLRLGGTGDDVETTARLLMIDPRGDDQHRNNAGGTTFLMHVPPGTRDLFAVAIALDLAGNDVYDSRDFSAGFATDGSQGSGDFGVGVLIDREGSDRYYCGDRCQGSGSQGIGVLRDSSGDDGYECRAFCLAAAGQGIGILRDDLGDDRFAAGGFALAGGIQEPGVALLWEREGTDDYTPQLPTYDLYGVTFQPNSADALFVDEGSELDVYSPSVPVACNGCAWRQGTPFDRGKMNGEGNDASGGLAVVLAGHWP